MSTSPSPATSGSSAPTSPPQSPVQRFKDQKAQSKAIEKQLRTEKRVMMSELKLLLLGTGDSGKSTIVKQMKIIHMKGYTDEDRQSHKSLIHRNIVEILHSLILGCSILQIAYDPTFSNLAEKIEKQYDTKNFDLDSATIQELSKFAQDASMQKALVSSGSKFQIHSSSDYFLKQLERIALPDYIPNDMDILCTRLQTTSVSETRFSVRGINFRMIDVGGQRGHREKWIHHFSDVTSILFIVSLSEYDQVLEEDATTNRLTESVKVFDQIINSRWFVQTPIILFLNKRDLFAEKIKRIPLSQCFTDYTGQNNFDDGVAYIKRKLLSTNKSPKNIYTHVTTATDTSNISAVFDAVKDILTRQTMEDGGI